MNLIFFAVFASVAVQILQNRSIYLWESSTKKGLRKSRKPSSLLTKSTLYLFGSAFVGKANHWDICDAGAASQKVGNEPKALWGRLQPNSRRECDLLRKRRSSGMSELWFLHKKSEQAIYSLLRRGSTEPFRYLYFWHSFVYQRIVTSFFHSETSLIISSVLISFPYLTCNQRIWIPLQ